MSTELEKIVGAGALTASDARPDFIKSGTAGTEDITQDDLRLPRLSIVQGLSKQIIPSDPKFMPGLTMFDLFNDLTGKNYGKGPIPFIPVKRSVLGIQFDPANRNVPLDFDVPLNDARMKWAKDEHGKKVPPLATKFIEFVILLLSETEPPTPVVMSIKETNKWQRDAAERLTGFIKLGYPPADIFAKIYTVSSATASNDKGTFGVFTFQQKGWVSNPDLFKFAKEFREQIISKGYTTEREPGDDDFDTDAMDADASGM